MDDDSLDMGGAVFCIAGDADGAPQTFVVPELTQAQRTRTVKTLATHVSLETFSKHIPLHTAFGMAGCTLSAQADLVRRRFVVEGCNDFGVSLLASPQHKDTAGDTVQLQITGHGLRSCGMMAGEWYFALPPAVRFITLVQTWPWQEVGAQANAQA